VRATGTEQQRGTSDVLVIGAGPAGAAAGITLARRGVRVTVVDRAVFPRDKTCGDAVSNDGLELLGRLGASAATTVAPHAVVARAAAVFPDGTRITREYDRPGAIIPRYHLDDCLKRALVDAGATVLEGVAVDRLARDGERFSGASGPAFSWSAAVVIAADGYGSIGQKALGQGRPRGRHLAVSSTAYYRGVDFPHGADTADHYFEQELPYGYGWIFPAVDGKANVGVYLRSDGYERTGRKLKDLMDDFLKRRGDRLGRAQPVGSPRVWSLPLAPRPTPIAAPGLLLTGDAANLVDPLTGEGIWQALHAGIAAGDVAADAVRQGGLDASLAARYEDTCARDIARPSRGKAFVQRAMLEIVERRLYENTWIRRALAFGYEHRALEMTKS
jgi:geranylgeranyl reductase family protein